MFKWLKAWFSQRESVQKLSTNITIESSLDKTISRAEDLKVLSTLLQFTPDQANLLCHIVQYRDDFKAYVFCHATPAEFAKAVQNLISWQDFQQVLSELDESFLELLDCASTQLTVDQFQSQLIHFINAEKDPCQQTCLSTDDIFFDRYSHTNGYTFIWGKDNQLNLIVYDVG